VKWLNELNSKGKIKGTSEMAGLCISGNEEFESVIEK
jgi:hypothetical protein